MMRRDVLHAEVLLICLLPASMCYYLPANLLSVYDALGCNAQILLIVKTKLHYVMLA